MFVVAFGRIVVTGAIAFAENFIDLVELCVAFFRRGEINLDFRLLRKRDRFGRPKNAVFLDRSHSHSRASRELYNILGRDGNKSR